MPNGNEYSDACRKKFPEENIIIVCADIEDQIMVLQESDRKDFIWRATHDGLVAQDFSNPNIDDCFSLCHDANINVINLDQEYGSILPGDLANISPVHKKDMLNWHLLAANTGIVADMDILFIRSLDAEYTEFLESGAEFGITCFSGLPLKNYLPVSIMFGKNSEFCNEVFLKSKEEYDPDVYESCGANLFSPTLHEEVVSSECAKFYRINDELIFPLTTKMNFGQAIQTQYYSGPVVSNCHHISSEVFSRALPKIGCKYNLGLSATPTRKDGLTKVFKWFLGPFVHKETKRELSELEVRLIDYYSNDETLIKEVLVEYSISKNYGIIF